MKNPTILEGGIARVFSNIRKLFTRENNTDNLITWVPESDRQLTTKYITQNGVYRAADDGYYAYSSVTVSVSTDSGVTGEGDDGEQHYVAPDPDTGELVDTIIPSSIVIETPPTKLLYDDGEQIDATGIVVKAYLESGELWTDETHPDGILPLEELSLNPLNATFDEATHVDRSAASDILPYTENQDKVAIAARASYMMEGFTEQVDRYAAPATWLCVTQTIDHGYISIICAAESDVWEGTQIFSYTYGGKTVYYSLGNYANYCYDISPAPFRPRIETSGENAGKIAWTMIYGDFTPSGSAQNIEVSWTRIDGGVLSDSYQIVVLGDVS